MRILPSLLLVAVLTACTQPDQSGPGEIRWDQETCTRCAMSIGDREYAAQVRGGASNAATRLYKFDDIGCAVIWLDQQPWKDDPRTEIWVADHRDGNWIDARKALYVTGRNTPMGYGLGAQTDSGTGLLDFSMAKKHIYTVEKSRHIHGGHHNHE
jgi:nitrous oxide reductase accessory protein NosL